MIKHKEENNIFIEESDKLLSKIEKYLDKNHYRIVYKIWKTQQERDKGGSEKLVCETSLSEAIKKPLAKYKKGGCFEIWAEGPDKLLLYHKSNCTTGLYKPTLDKIKI